VSLLATYLNDHLAGATAGRELARRAAAGNRGSAYAEPLQRLAVEIDEDRSSLIAIMRALDVGVDPLKVAGGWTAEKLGRLKLNGRLIGYSPLSRLLELEVLALGVQGKLSMWTALKLVLGGDPRLSAFDLDALCARARRQLEELETQRGPAALEALG
jgi:hypothetical protein